VNGPFRAEEQERRPVTQAFRPGLAEPAFQAGGVSCRICSLGCREDVNKSMPRESWYNRPFRPVESFSPSFLAWIMSAMCRMKPTWKRRVVKTLFLPFDPVLRDHGPCVRRAIIGSYTSRRALCPSGDDWQLETPRFETFFLPFDPVLRHLGACPRGAMIGS
jgi:hypothetical protein